MGFPKFKLSDLERLNPTLHKQLVSFCSALDQIQFPEAIAIADNKIKTLAGFAAIYKRMKHSKKDRRAIKRLREAEKMVVSIGALYHRNAAVVEKHNTHERRGFKAHEPVHEFLLKKRMKKSWLEEQARKLAEHMKHRFNLQDGSEEEFGKKYGKYITSFKLTQGIQWENHVRGTMLYGSKVEENDLVLIHLTRFVPENGVIKTGKEAGKINGRLSIHFTLNGPVGSHAYGNWEDIEMAVIIPLEKMKHRIANFNPVDTYAFGKVVLPEGSIFLISKKMAEKHNLADGQKLGNAIVEIVDTAAVRSPKMDYNSFKWAIIERIARMGYLPMDVGMWDWAGEGARSWAEPKGLGHLAIKNGWSMEWHFDTLTYKIDDFSIYLNDNSSKLYNNFPAAYAQIFRLRESVLNIPESAYGRKAEKKHLITLVDECITKLREREIDALCKAKDVYEIDRFETGKSDPWEPDVFAEETKPITSFREKSQHFHEASVGRKLYFYLGNLDEDRRLDWMLGFIESGPAKRRTMLGSVLVLQ